MNYLIDRVRENESKLDNLLSSRSYLYNLEPIGIGTPYVESLTSYISRLAFAHCVPVGKLLNQEIAKELSIDWLKKVFRESVFASSYYINSGNHVALDFVDSINPLTSRNDLINLTLISWRGIIQKGITRTKKCWCKLCLNEWREDGDPIYEPLYWYINLTESCFKHNVSLSSVCPHCCKAVPIIKTNIILGYCSNCMGWLGEDPIYRVEEKIDVNWIKSVNNNVGKLLSNSSSLTNYPIKTVLTNIVGYLIDMFSNGNRSEFAKEFGFDPGTVARWKRGDTFIPFQTLLKFSYYLNMDIIELLSIELKRTTLLEDINCEAKSLFYQEKPYNQHNVNKLRAALENEIINNEKTPRSLAAVLTSLSLSEYGAYTYARDLCEIITSRYKDHRTKLRVNRIGDIENEIREIKSAIIQNGEDLTLNNFRKRYDKKVYNKEMEFLVQRIIME
ncbi:helix-turn-helix domain-containing protein [Niallia sp. FSL R7-0271]|uniref:helix-turn-helix domain-containing protein n=1 Tax=Niallia sp. FSL R7-0271 TaxID=2921678 RepID=UPI0030FB4116